MNTTESSLRRALVTGSKGGIERLGAGDNGVPDPATTNVLYTETTGCTCYIDGRRGVTTGFTLGPGLIGPETNGAFVKLDEGDRATLYVTLGAKAHRCSCGADDLGRDEHSQFCDLNAGERYVAREVLSYREINRDEFDRITGIAEMRAEMGWRA